MTLDLAKLRAETLALIDGTTPGPWVADPSQGEISSKEWAGYPVFCLDQSNYDRASNDIGLNNQQHRDFSLAAAAPTLAADTLRLLDEIERLRGALVEAAIPLEAMILATQDDTAGRRLYGELLWNGIVAGVEAVRTALTKGGPDDR